MDEDEGKTTFSYAEHLDQATIEQVRDIENTIAESSPLVGEQEDISVLRHDYSIDDDVYQIKLQDLCKKYGSIRKTRGDGNCFYRCFGFKAFEECLKNKPLADKLMEVATLSKEELIKLGYSSYTVEDFHETFCEVMEIAKKSDSLDEIFQLFNEQSYSDYIVVFLRLIVSSYLQQNEQFYSAFIETHETMKDFCSQEVEPMLKESDHIHIIALTNACRVTVQVEYMDRSGHSLNHHLFPDDGSAPLMYLLYRPGHYDILYKHGNTGSNSASSIT